MLSDGVSPPKSPKSLKLIQALQTLQFLSLFFLFVIIYIYRAHAIYINVYRLIIRQNIRQNRIGDGRQSRRGNGRRYGRVMEEGTEWATEAVMEERMERRMEGGMRDKKEDRRQRREGSDFCAIARSIDLTFNILTSVQPCLYLHINKLYNPYHHLVTRYFLPKFLFAPKSGLLTHFFLLPNPSLPLAAQPPILKVYSSTPTLPEHTSS